MVLLANTGRISAFQNRPFPIGIDMKRSKIGRKPGYHRIQSGASIRPGMVVTETAGVLGDALIIPITDATTAANPVGFAAYGTTSGGYSQIIDEEVRWTTATGVVQLLHANVSNLVVRASKYYAVGRQFVGGGTDYTLSATNGTLTRVDSGNTGWAINTTYYVTYTWALSTDELALNGVKFGSNTQDDVAYSSDDRLAIITDWSEILTTEFVGNTAGSGSGASNIIYNIGDDLWVATDGKVTNVNPANADLNRRRFLGKCFQVPMTGDPFLGVRYHGNPTMLTAS